MTAQPKRLSPRGRLPRRGFSRVIQDPFAPILGDLLRVTFHASRFHPDAGVRAAIGDSLDRMLDAARTTPHSAAEVAGIFARNPGTPLAPMIADADDAALAARLWRYCGFAHVGLRRSSDESAHATELLVTSADAVGTGHGVLLDEEPQIRPEDADNRDYLPRQFSHGAKLARLHLAMARRSTGIAAPACLDVATLASDRTAGVVIEIRLADAPGQRPCLGTGSWLAPLGHEKGGHARPTLEASAIKVECPSPRRMRVLPQTPEGAIRLIAACADRAVMHVPTALIQPDRQLLSPHWLPPGAFDILVQLAPIEETAVALPCIRHTHGGQLADWIRFPRLPLAPDLAPDLRAAIAAHYAPT
jgi:hypothetical protein